MEIRKAIKNDIHQLVYLMGQLGYPTSVDKIQIRFNNIESNPNYNTLVANLGK